MSCYGRDYMSQYYDGFGHMMGGLPLILLGLVLLLILGFLLYNGWKKGIGKQTETPLELLQKRYVNGEISREEYQEKKAALKQK